MMPLFLLDRGGVFIVNRSTNVKTPADLELLPLRLTASPPKSGDDVGASGRRNPIPKRALPARSRRGQDEQWE